jgi:hypothetical protein
MPRTIGSHDVDDGDHESHSVVVRKRAHAPRCVGCKLDSKDEVAQCSVCGNWYFKSCNGPQWWPMSK